MQRQGIQRRRQLRLCHAAAMADLLRQQHRSSRVRRSGQSRLKPQRQQALLHPLQQQLEPAKITQAAGHLQQQPLPGCNADTRGKSHRPQRCLLQHGGFGFGLPQLPQQARTNTQRHGQIHAGQHPRLPRLRIGYPHLSPPLLQLDHSQRLLPCCFVQGQGFQRQCGKMNRQPQHASILTTPHLAQPGGWRMAWIGKRPDRDIEL